MLVMIITEINKPINNGPVVGKVAAVAGIFGFCTKFPASANTATMIIKRPTIMANAVVS